MTHLFSIKTHSITKSYDKAVNIQCSTTQISVEEGDKKGGGRGGGGAGVHLLTKGVDCST